MPWTAELTDCWPVADLVRACAVVPRPLHDRIAAHVLAAERLHGDDTPVPVLAKGKTDTGRVWVYVRDDEPFGDAVPLLAGPVVADVEHKDILSLHNGLHHMPTVANRAADILVKMFNLADAWGWRPTGTNPCRGVSRFKVEKHERFLTREELYRLGQALRAAPAERLASTHAAAAIRLLVLTGCRRNEILGLRWDDLNFETGKMRLRDSKTSARMVPLPPKSAEVFAGLSRTPDNPWVFPGRKKGTRLVNLKDSWDRVRKRAGHDGVRLHDLGRVPRGGVGALASVGSCG